MIDLEDLDDIAAEVADIMGNGNLDLSNLNFSVLQEFPDEAAPVKEEKTILVATPQLSAPTVTTKQSVPNTYKDLHDSADGWISSAEDKEALMDHEINQLSDLSLEIGFPGNVDEIMNALEQGTPVPIPVGSNSVQLKLSFYMDKMPHGIVDKQVAGIGATSLEIDSKRNSIIVFPTKILAYNKWQRNKTKLLYVGGKINDERDTTSIKEIQSYLSDDKVVYKKFLVVADSLYKLLQIIGKEHYKDLSSTYKCNFLGADNKQYKHLFFREERETMSPFLSL